MPQVEREAWFREPRQVIGGLSSVRLSVTANVFIYTYVILLYQTKQDGKDPTVWLQRKVLSQAQARQPFYAPSLWTFRIELIFSPSLPS